MLFVKNDAMHLYNSKTVERKEGGKEGRKIERKEGGGREAHIPNIVCDIQKNEAISVLMTHLKIERFGQHKRRPTQQKVLHVSLAYVACHATHDAAVA